MRTPPHRLRRRSHRGPRRPVALLHHLDGLLTLAAMATRVSGVRQRRQRQRLALAQRLLDPLPGKLASPQRVEVWFWRLWRWGTPGLLLAWWLKS